MANHVLNHKSWSLLLCGTSLCCTLCFYIAYGRHGNTVNFLFTSTGNNIAVFLVSSLADYNLSNILGMQGLWMGIICGLLVQVIVLVTVNLFTDWKKEVSDNVFWPVLLDI